jgi:hypothetical protein
MEFTGPNICQRFDLKSTEYMINKLGIGCGKLREMTTRSFFSTPSVKSSTTDYYVDNEKGIKAVTALVSTNGVASNPGIRQIGVQWSKDTCMEPMLTE